MHVSEERFEEAIERALLAGGPDAYPNGDNAVRERRPPYGDFEPGGYRRRKLICPQ
ncbi:hypothetical protein ACFLXE_06450 [Chloroflexota bacterium]